MVTSHVDPRTAFPLEGSIANERTQDDNVYIQFYLLFCIWLGGLSEWFFLDGLKS